MANLTENQNKLKEKLAEMFQFDQADLDFGIYRIMNYKRDEIKRFLEHDLMSQISSQLAELSQNRNSAELEELEKEIKTVSKGKANPDIKAVMIADLEKKKEALTAASDISAVEADIYSHLTEFFSRYYDEGDFISQRFYKDGVYAIPYEGEEVKLHWANADQYYVKTSEYFKDYTFKTEHGQIVHFKITEAETEKDNNKGKNRFFQLHTEAPFALENGELIIYFEYKVGEKKKQENYNAEVITEFTKVVLQYPDFASLLTVSNGKSLLERQLNRYTARNTFDYFIHKDLCKFLNRELDFYIKNDVIFLDDIDEQDERKTREYLVKAKAIRTIGEKIITFLAQIEDFQKKLWLKKKFVVETNYCITLNLVPREFYQQIIESKAQLEEWVRLFAIDEIQPTDGSSVEIAKVGFSDPLTIKFLEQNPYLVLDTAFFTVEFKEQVIDRIDNLDESLDGLLIQSENFQALNLLGQRYNKQVKCIYIDPPYNADSSEILYKNTFKHSSWISLMENRLYIAKAMQSLESVLVVAIDEVEQVKLGMLLDMMYPELIRTNIAIVSNPSGQQGNTFSYTHDYACFVYPDEKGVIGKEHRNDGSADIRPLRDVSGNENRREDAANCFYPIYVKDNIIIGFGEVSNDEFHPTSANVVREDGVIEIYPIDTNGIEKKWVFARQTVESIFDELRVEYNSSRKIYDIIRTKHVFNFKTAWTDKKYSANSYGSKLLTAFFKKTDFLYPKSLFNVIDCIRAGLGERSNGYVLDFFAGSATTGHAVINLNPEDGGIRKYILVEMGEYFDTVTKPRIQKVIYSMDIEDGTKGWKDGKPVSRKGSSHAFKYLRLESYDDALNNILIDDSILNIIDNPAVKEQYMLHYMLPNETIGSVSLLNIDMLEHPFNYAMNITRNKESKETNIDLVETFNYLIGLKVERSYALKSFDAEFTTGEHEAVTAKLTSGTIYCFKMVEGITISGEKTLVIWRDTTGDKIKDNAVLDAFFERKKANTINFEYKKIFVNGDNNLLNLRTHDENWNVILIEEEMKEHMFSNATI